MSNELAILNLGLPDYLKDLTLDDTTKALMGGGRMTKRISIRGSVWRMMVNGKEVVKNEDRALNVVVVAGAPKKSRSYYEKKWEEGDDPTAPTCWSADGEVPDERVPTPQAKRCMDCPMNVKGSGDGDSRACRYFQRLALVLANDISGDVFQITLPGASVFGEGSPGKWPLQTYSKMIGSKGIPITAVVTEMRFDTDSSTPKVTFKPVRILEAHEHQEVIRQGQSEAAKQAIAMTVGEVDGAKLPAPSSSGTVQAQRVIEAKAEPVVEVIAEPVVEPVKRTAKKAEEAAPKTDLSKILSDWDD